MARMLVIFGTGHGHTATIAAAVAAALRSQGHETTLVDSAAGSPDAASYDGVIVAASLHARGYQRRVVAWVRRHAAALNARPTAFVSVCLGVLQHDPAVDRELRLILDRFLQKTGWRPLERHIVAGALPYSRYSFLTRWVMRRIVARAGGDTDTSRDYEYTDWADLRAFVLRFGERVGLNGGAAPKSPVEFAR